MIDKSRQHISQHPHSEKHHHSEEPDTPPVPEEGGDATATGHPQTLDARVGTLEDEIAKINRKLEHHGICGGGE